MNKYTKMLISALSVTLSTAIIGMEKNISGCKDDIKSKLAPYTTHRINPDILIEQANNMISFVKDPVQNEVNMLRLGRWLTNQRKTITDTKTWILWMDELRGVMLRKINDQCDRIESKRAFLVMATIFGIAFDLEPNQECLTPLIQDSISIIKEADSWTPTTSDLISLFSFIRHR